MVDFSKIKTIPIATRTNKFDLSQMIRPGTTPEPFRDSNLEDLAEEIVKAYTNDRMVLLMMGAHVIKVGCSELIINLIKKGVIKHIAMNGAGPIHDFEIAYQGATSEYVEKNIENGTFGMAEETGRYMNEAIIEGSRLNMGLGEAIGKKILDMDLKYKQYSIVATAYSLGVPLTVHSAIGTEIIHQHPSCDGAAIGKTTYEDFKRITDSISKLERGVVINLGSAVILPEVFLKAFTIARNLGYEIKNFTAANLDMIDHYRPRVNVVERPTSLGGKGYIIIGKHQQTVPTLYNIIKEKLD